MKVDSILAHYNPGETEALWQDPPTATSVQLHYQVSTAVGPFIIGQSVPIAAAEALVGTGN